MTKGKIKIFSVILLTAFIIGETAVLLQPTPVSAITSITAVPVQLQGGTLDNDLTAITQGAARAAGIAALNTAFRAMSNKINATLENKLGIRSTLLYQQALVDSKYLIDSYSRSYGEESVARDPNDQRELIYDIAQVVAGFEALPLNTNLTAAESARLALRAGSTRNPQEREREVQKLIVGASALFSSSIACGGLNQQAIRNTASYLAALSAGVRPADIDPRNRLTFYQSMMRLGSPQSNPNFWALQFQDIGAQKEAEARQAAAIEQFSPGLKAPQQISSSGRIQTGRSLNLISVGQDNAQSALFNIGIKGGESAYDTGSLQGFIGSVINIQLGTFIQNQLGGFLGGLFGGSLQSVQDAINTAATTVATSLVRNFALSLYDQVSNSLFQGQILGESGGCRKPSRAREFTPQDRDFNNIPLNSEGPVGNIQDVFFTVSSAQITAGEEVLVSWDASFVGNNVQVTLTGGGIGGSKPVFGDATDRPQQTTTYTLQVTAPGFSDSISRTVTVTATQVGSVQLAVVPQSIEEGRRAALTWDFSAVTNDVISIVPLTQSGDELPPFLGADEHSPSGALQCYATPINESMQFVFFAESDLTGELVQRQIIVNPVEPPARTFDFTADRTAITLGESALLSWNISGYTNATINMFDGGQIPSNGALISDSLAVSPTATTTYAITVTESNGCSPAGAPLVSGQIEIGVTNGGGLPRS